MNKIINSGENKEMKVILRTILILAVISTVATGIAKECLAVFIDETASITAAASKEEDIDLDSPILDNFNDGGITNLWEGDTSVFDDGLEGSCSFSNNSVSPYEGVYCLKLDYDVSTIDGYSGYYSKLIGKNLSAYTSVSFWVKGASGGEFFKIELKNNSTDANRNHAAVYITDYLDGGVTTSWQKVTIPFHNFANISDWTSMKEFVIVLENYQSNINGSSTQGTIYIDEIRFNSTAVDVVRIDHFGDKLGICALGGNMPTATGGDGSITYSFSWAGDTFHNSPNGLKLDYDVSNLGSYAATVLIFGGGNTGWTVIPHNFSEYDYISFWIRAESDTKNPQGIKIELHDYSGVGTGEPFYVNGRYTANHIETTWKKFTISLSSFKDWDVVALDKTRISELVFTFEEGNAADKSGTVYIDEVQFE